MNKNQLVIYLLKCVVYGVIHGQIKYSLRLLGFTFRYNFNRMNNKDVDDLFLIVEVLENE